MTQSGESTFFSNLKVGIFFYYFNYYKQKMDRLQHLSLIYKYLLILTKATQVKAHVDSRSRSGDFIAPLRSGIEGGSPLDFLEAEE